MGGGYAGVEALSELRDLAQDALRYHPALADVPQRWVLVDAAPKILAEIPSRLGQYVYDLLLQRGVDIRLNTRLEKVVDGRVSLSDGTEFDAGLLVWTAGVKADPVVARFGLPLDERGRARVGPTLQVEGRQNVWALGDCAACPNRRHRWARSTRPPANMLCAKPGSWSRTSLLFGRVFRWGTTVSGRSGRSPPWAAKKGSPTSGVYVCGAFRAGWRPAASTSSRCPAPRAGWAW